ncbi:unnamed protein product [Lymnaea stagnalis]|uniref:BHLH domain-containing protein n=1 Tax=Lymnaea stagnalis TaxID=6523 RepID=A0AAV2IN68_LYMST
MPGVLSCNSQCVGYSTVGKMAFFMDPDLINFNSDDDVTDVGDIASRIFGPSSTPLSQASQSNDNTDSDCELPDNEHPVDLIKYLDSPEIDIDLPKIKCEGDCNVCTETPNKYNKYRVSARQDPFMGMGGSQSHSSTNCGTHAAITATSPVLTALDFDFDPYSQQQILQQQRFCAWGHKNDDGFDLMLNKSSITSLLGILEDDIEEVTFPDTPSPSSRSGDDSDVDIETVTDAPRSADSCGYVTQDSSPSMSPAASPSPFNTLASVSLQSAISKSSSICFGSVSPSSSSKSSGGFTSYGVSSSASLAENLMAGRTSLHGQKRKLAKEKKIGSKSPQPVYTHILCNSNSVNFHDYAMSPGAYTFPSTSTETGRPTVMSKRIYKRKQLALDASDKEKQHHHNQLERNRRQKLADLFVDLRDEVPKIANQAKASKVVILNESTLYIRELQKFHKQQEDDISKELQRKEMLKKQLRHLQSQISRGGFK